MTDTVMISLIGAGATVALATVNGIFAIIGNARGARNEQHLVETKEAVMKVQTQTDGLQDKLMKAVGETEHAKGVKEGESAASGQTKCARHGGTSRSGHTGTGHRMRSRGRASASCAARVPILA